MFATTYLCDSGVLSAQDWVQIALLSSGKLDLQIKKLWVLWLSLNEKDY